MASPPSPVLVRRADTGPDARGADVSWVVERLIASWGGTEVVSRGRVIDASTLPALVAEIDGEGVGLATYEVNGEQCELVTIDAFREGQGVGAALVAAVADEARRLGCVRLWLVTTNDNLRALRFYQRRGLRLVAVHVDALTRSRVLKPSIPLVGLDGIPLRDELELELDLRLAEPGVDGGGSSPAHRS